MSFHSKMIKLRKIKGFTQETFATEVGVSRQSVYKWESGQSYPEVEKLLKIARTFGVTVDDMLNDEMEVGRDGTMMPLADFIALEEKLAKEAEEKRARRAAAKARREAKKASEEAEAPVEEAPVEEATVAEEAPAEEATVAEEAPAAEEAPVEEKKEEVKEEKKEEKKEEVKKAAPATLPSRPAAPEKKKGGLFGLFRRKN